MDKYADIRAALDAATPGPWKWITEICERGPVGKGNTIRVSLSAPRNSHATARTAVLAPNWNTSEGDVWQAWISCNGANAAYIAACHPEAIRALLAERDALREALRWTAGALQASCVAGKVTEADTARSLIGNETKSIGQILDAADAALAQERGTSNAQRNPD